jgi:hypothetical protein
MNLYREVQNVLSFSIKTAEQSLSENAPDIVTKLIEGRKKRLQLIDHSYDSKKKDIEQRSIETNAVSTSHLEVFQTKAIDNTKSAESMTKSGIQEVMKVLFQSEKHELPPITLSPSNNKHSLSQMSGEKEKAKEKDKGKL